MAFIIDEGHVQGTAPVNRRLSRRRTPDRRLPYLGRHGASQCGRCLVKVELFHSAGCKRCATARAQLKSAAEQAVPGIVWREIDPADEIDYAVEVGVMSLPAVVVDGQLAFSSLPTPDQLTKELQRRAAGAHHGR